METMDDYKDMLEASFKKFRVGDIVKGRVISVDETSAILDFNYYAPGKIYATEFSDNPAFQILEEIKVGDEITATVIKTDDGAGNILLSAKSANHEVNWEKFAGFKAEKTPVSVRISEAVKGGVTAYLEGIRGFIPASKLDLSYVEDEDLKSYVGKTVEVLVVTVDEESEKLILSCRELKQEAAKRDLAGRAAKLQIGAIFTGTVQSLKDYGAFVDIGDGMSGLVHISQIPYPKKLTHPKYALKEGQEVRVKVTKVENGKVSLSMKDLDDPMNKDIEETVTEYIDEEAPDNTMAKLLKSLGF
ncbi:MAG: S1 RNA-binding domain-containing protein [Lachnospiraceae bacterium]|nr:S1 RNA-binding domain-containing protein [Lachnospiraceae bacterium]